MSERAALFGKKVAPFTIEHDGTPYTFTLGITEGVLLEVETRLYQRAVASLQTLRSAYGEPEYLKRLDALRVGYETGDYDVLQSKAVQQFLKTEKGAIFLLSIMGNMTEKQLIPLFMAKTAELTGLVRTALGISLPLKRAGGPKAKGRAKKKR